MDIENSPQGLDLYSQMSKEIFNIISRHKNIILKSNKKTIEQDLTNLIVDVVDFIIMMYEDHQYDSSGEYTRGN
jgi:hypothetical protein